MIGNSSLFGVPKSFLEPSAPEDANLASEKPRAVKREALSVTDAVNRAKSILVQHSFRILGEVSELNNKPGYKAVYFTIKDEGAALPCLMWKSRFQASGVELHIGAKVEITGKFTIFAAKGRMNFDVSHIALAGEGDLRAKVAQLANRLRTEGLMDESRKRPLPEFPQVIGVVTSPRGAAVHDVLRTLRRRYPLARIVFAGVQVEGKQAPALLTQALDALASSGAEVVLLVRGGGSFEDLMPFNDEALVRKVASMPVPVVTGIGHEPDTSIADMVADVRASTPTAAAEAVSPHMADIDESIQALYARMTGSLTNRLHRSVVFLDGIASRPLFKDPDQLFASEAQAADMLQERLECVPFALISDKDSKLSMLEARFKVGVSSFGARDAARIDAFAQSLRSFGPALLSGPSHELELKKASLQRSGEGLLDAFKSEAALSASRLNDLSPLHILERGWSVAKSADGSIVTSVKQVKPADRIRVHVRDGSLTCRVEQGGITESDSLLGTKGN